MSRVLVTGATGFIGSQVVPLLVEHGHEVHAVARGAATRADAAWHAVDLLDAVATRALLDDVRPSHVLHLAWDVGPGFWTSSANLSWAAASLVMIERFSRNGGTRFVGAGTCAEYAWGRGPCVEDATPLQPATLYGTAKNALRALLAAEVRERRFSHGWARVFGLYGPREPGSKLVASVINSALAGRDAPCGNGLLVRDYLHVADVAAALVAILESDVEGAVNVASGRGVALGDLARRAATAAGRPDVVRLDARPARAGEPEELIADVSRLRSTGWQPRFDLDAGLADAVAWWRDQADAAG